MDDRETVAQITENTYLQYFLGYSAYIREAPFDAVFICGYQKEAWSGTNQGNSGILSVRTAILTEKWKNTGGSGLDSIRQRFLQT